MQLDVLTIGDISGISAKLLRDLGDRSGLGAGECAAVTSHSHHEELGIKLLRR
jgi:hypothetical protein